VVPVVLERALAAVERDQSQSGGLAVVHEIGLYKMQPRPGSLQRLHQPLTDDARCGPYVHLPNVGALTALGFEDDGHATANVLLRFFREMPEPLFPSAAFEHVLSLGALLGRLGLRKHSPTALLSAVEPQLLALLRCVPQAHFALLLRLTEHLNRVAKYATINFMPLPNLALVFSPLLLRKVARSAEEVAAGLGGRGRKQQPVGEGEDEELRAAEVTPKPPPDSALRRKRGRGNRRSVVVFSTSNGAAAAKALEEEEEEEEEGGGNVGSPAQRMPGAVNATPSPSNKMIQRYTPTYGLASRKGENEGETEAEDFADWYAEGDGEVTPLAGAGVGGMTGSTEFSPKLRVRTTGATALSSAVLASQFGHKLQHREEATAVLLLVLELGADYLHSVRQPTPALQRLERARLVLAEVRKDGRAFYHLPPPDEPLSMRRGKDLAELRERTVGAATLAQRLREAEEEFAGAEAAYLQEVRVTDRENLEAIADPQPERAGPRSILKARSDAVSNSGVGEEREFASP